MSVSIWNINDISLKYFDPDDLKNKNKANLKSKLMYYFLRAYFFKCLFKLARKLDKTVNMSKILNFQVLYEICFNKTNFTYGAYFLMIKTLFKVYRFMITRWFDKNWFEETYETQEKLNYKMVNIISGLIISLLGVYLGQGSNLIFYTVIYYLIKNLFSFILFKSNWINLNKKQESKMLLYIGFSGSFLLASILIPNLRNSLKLLSYFN